MTNTDLRTGANPHDLDDRQAMALPERLVERMPVDTGQRHRDLFDLAPGTLATVVECGSSLSRRCLAGTLLALRGDPRVRPDDPEMVDVPDGTGVVGLPWADVDAVLDVWARRGVQRDWIAKECPRHTIHVARFRMMRYPVTNLEYARYLHDTGRWPAPSSWTFGIPPYERANHPVWTVTPADADGYARWLAERTGRAFRLPTEIEWEYAASGGDGRAYPWGDEFRQDAANTVESGPLSTTPIGCYPAGRSPFGIDDMAGNVEEYVADDYRPWPDGPDVRDDLARGSRSYRIARGGSFTRFGDLARCARRHGWYRRDYYAVGFRLAEDA